MVANIKTLVIQQIKQTFNNIKVYDQQVKQGLVTPAFLVLIFGNDQERKIKRRVMRTYTFNVTYFPSNRGNQDELDTVYETFQNEFQYVANLYHINRLEHVKEDGVLVITFTINALLKEVEEEVTKMQTLGGVEFE